MFPSIQQDPNIISARQEQFEQQETVCRIRCAALDTVQRETLALIVGIAQTQLTVVTKVLAQPVEARDFQTLVPQFQEQLPALENDIVADYDSLLRARDFYLHEGHLVALNKDVRARLVQQFRFSLTDTFRQSVEEMACPDTGSLERLKQKLEERIRIKTSLVDTVLDGKTRITEEMHSILKNRDRCAKMRRDLLAAPPTESEQLLDGIRFFDLRISLEEDMQFYATHGLLGENFDIIFDAGQADTAFVSHYIHLCYW